MVDTDPESSQAVHSWTLMIGVQDGALDLLRELQDMKMSLEMLQVTERSSAGQVSPRVSPAFPLFCSRPGWECR